MTTKLDPCEREYDFTLVLSGELTENALNSLFTAGCDDATFSVRSGRPVASFSRMASSFSGAVLSALVDIRRANAGVTVLRVDECNMVTQAEIGHRIRRSRQLIHQYVTGTRGPGGFPPPACDITSESPLWYWCEVAHWLWENDFIKEDVWQEAEEIDVINTVLEHEDRKKKRPELAEHVHRSLFSEE